VSGKLADDTAEEACETTGKMAFITKTKPQAVILHIPTLKMLAEGC